MNITTTDEGNVIISIPISIKNVCGRKRAEVYGKNEISDVDFAEQKKILLLFARAYSWMSLLESGAFVDVTSLAAALKLDRANVTRILNLANVSPNIVRAVIHGPLPDGFTKEKLLHMKSILWEDQESELGIAFLAA